MIGTRTQVNDCAEAIRERNNAVARAAVQLSRIRIAELRRLIDELDPGDPAWSAAAREYKTHMETVKMPNCPACGATIDEGMLYAGDTVPPADGGFWGAPGQRFKVCEAGAWFHFRTANGLHRLAYLAGRARPGVPA